MSTCRAHARRDPGAGKWLCYTCVATGLAVSAGIEDEELSDLRFNTSYEFEERFRELAEVSSDRRRYWHSGPGESLLGGYLERHPAVSLTDWGLAGDAIGVGEFLLPGPQGGPNVEVASSLGARNVLTSGLAGLIEELRGG